MRQIKDELYNVKNIEWVKINEGTVLVKRRSNGLDYRQIKYEV